MSRSLSLSLLLVALMGAVSREGLASRCAAGLVHEGGAGRLAKALEATLLLGSGEWSVVAGAPEPTIVLSGLNEADFRRALDEAKEIQEAIGQATAGKFRSFGVHPVEVAGARAAFWGVCFAAAAAGLYMVPEDAAVLAKVAARGFAAFTAYRTFRWFRTLDDSLAREERIPESNLWGALGPAESPLHYWLKQYAHDGAVQAVLWVARASSDAVRERIRRGEPGDPAEALPIPLPLGCRRTE